MTQWADQPGKGHTLSRGMERYCGMVESGADMDLISISAI